VASPIQYRYTVGPVNPPSPVCQLSIDPSLLFPGVPLRSCCHFRLNLHYSPKPLLAPIACPVAFPHYLPPSPPLCHDCTRHPATSLQFVGVSCCPCHHCCRKPSSPSGCLIESGFASGASRIHQTVTRTASLYTTAKHNTLTSRPYPTKI
jgi:hypothetical protein